MQTSTNLVKPIRFFHSYPIKEDSHGLKLQKLRLNPKNLELHEYKFRRNKWVKTKIPIKTKKTCFSHLKGLIGLNIPLTPSKAFHLLQSQKHVFINIQKLSVCLGNHTSSGSLSILQKSLNKMKHLTEIRDYNKEITLKEKCFVKVKCLGKVKNLDLPCHLMIKHLHGVRELTIDLEKLEKIGRVAVIPQSLRVLNVIDKNPLDKGNHVEALKMITEQINSLKNLEALNLVFPKKNYFYDEILSVLERKGIEVKIMARIDYEDEVLEEMQRYVERTGSCIKIIPSGYSDTEKYIKLLNFLLGAKNVMIKLERLIYPVNSEDELQKKVLEYYKKMSHMTKQVEFLLEFTSQEEWFELKIQSNFQEMLEEIKGNADADVKIVHYLTYMGHKDQQSKVKDKVRDVAMRLLLDTKLQELKQEKIMKVESNVHGFEILKAFISKLFEDSPLYQVERIDWVNHCLYIAGLPELLNNLKNKQNIKDYSIITYQ